MDRFPVLRKVLDLISLEGQLDGFDTIDATIRKDIIFKGTNLWILVFAILLASVGLNMNSTAVIIGAMLISPLMGPINGMGYSLATYDFTLFQKALKNFSFAVVSGLIASTAYFLITPISTAHSELLARTSPTIYDVMIAWFGGLAGIVAISSRNKGNVIPGVAIATALMPPLCTAGYGLATGKLSYFFGAFYLFTINTVFIAFSAMVVSQLLKFPIRTLVDPVRKKRVDQGISFVMVLVFIPSVYFGYNLVQKERFSENASRFVNSVSVYDGNFLLRNEVNPGNHSIVLIYGGTSLDDAQKEAIRTRALDFSLSPDKISFQQGLSFDQFNRANPEMENLKAEIARLNFSLQEKQGLLDSLLLLPGESVALLSEIQALFPGVVQGYVATGTGIEEPASPGSGRTTLVVLEMEGRGLSASVREQLSEWLKIRLKDEQVRVYYDFR